MPAQSTSSPLFGVEIKHVPVCPRRLPRTRCAARLAAPRSPGDRPAFAGSFGRMAEITLRRRLRRLRVLPFGCVLSYPFSKSADHTRLTHGLQHVNETTQL